MPSRKTARKHKQHGWAGADRAVALALLVCLPYAFAAAETLDADSAEAKQANETQPPCDTEQPCETIKEKDVTKAAQELFRQRFNEFGDSGDFDGNPMARFGFGHCHRYGTEMFCH